MWGLPHIARQSRGDDMIAGVSKETVVITGANRGIGLALVARYLTAGWRVFATSRNPDRSEALSRLSRERTSLKIFTLDVTDGDAVERFRALVADEVVDVLINNAGILGGRRQGVGGMDYAAWRQALEVNTIAPFRMATALLPNLARTRRPRVVTLSSQMGSLARKSSGDYAYRSSKAAVNKVMQTLAVELEREGVIVCPVHPGWVRTDMGGSGGTLSPEESANGLYGLIASLTMAHSGRFWTWDGKEHPW